VLRDVFVLGRPAIQVFDFAVQASLVGLGQLRTGRSNGNRSRPRSQPLLDGAKATVLIAEHQAHHSDDHDEGNGNSRQKSVHRLAS